MRGGVVHIDGQAAGMARLEDRVLKMSADGNPPGYRRCRNSSVSGGGDCIQEQWRETLPDGTTQVVLNTVGEVGVAPEARYSSADDTPVFTVPEGHVFVLGDHRDNSLDSRFPATGMIPIDNIRHSAWIVHSSSDRSHGSWRPHFARFFKRIE